MVYGKGTFPRYHDKLYEGPMVVFIWGVGTGVLVNKHRNFGDTLLYLGGRYYCLIFVFMLSFYYDN
jgi:hypothetical protein